MAQIKQDAFAEAGGFLRRHLEYNLPEVLTRRYSSLPFANGRYVRLMTDLPLGASSVIQETVDTYGDAAVTAGAATDVPLAHAGVGEDKYKVIQLSSAFQYSWNELLSAQQASRNGYHSGDLTNYRMFSARRAIAEKLNQVVAYGSPGLDVPGFYSNSHIPQRNESTDFINDSSVTAQEIADFLISEADDIADESQLTERPNVVLVPVALHTQLTTKSVSGTDTTIKEYVLKNSPYIEAIEPVTECKAAQLEQFGVTASGNGRDRVIFYPLNEEVVQGRITEAQQLPETQHDQMFKVVLVQFTAGCWFNYPKAARYVDIPTKS